MKKTNFNLGGEQSGHIILGKFATTGDGLLVGMEVLFSMRKGKKASEIFNSFKATPQILENIKVKEFTVLDARSKNRFLGLEPEPRPGIKSGSIEGSKSMPLNKIVNAEDNTFLDTKKLRDIFNSSEITSNKIVMSCGSSVSAASLALAYSLINDDYIPKIYIGSWTEFGKK